MTEKQRQTTTGELLERLRKMRFEVITHFADQPLPPKALARLEKLARLEVEISTGLPTMMVYENTNESPAERDIRKLGKMKNHLLEKKSRRELTFEERRLLRDIHDLEQSAIQKYIP